MSPRVCPFYKIWAAAINREGILFKINYELFVSFFLNKYKCNKYLYLYLYRYRYRYVYIYIYKFKPFSPLVFFESFVISIKVETFSVGREWFTLWFYFSIIFGLYFDCNPFDTLTKGIWLIQLTFLETIIILKENRLSINVHQHLQNDWNAYKMTIEVITIVAYKQLYKSIT